MKSYDRMEELAAGYVLGNLGAEEVRELEQLLSADDFAREHFAEFCMDEILLQNAMTRGADKRLELVPNPSLELDSGPSLDREPRWDAGKLVRAAALLLTFAAGWALSSVVTPADLLGRGARELGSVADPSQPPLPIYYPPAANRLAARPVVYPLDFDESGILSTNPFLQFQPVESTEL